MHIAVMISIKQPRWKTNQKKELYDNYKTQQLIDLLVVTFANASAQPHTMMVELKYTVITYIAMTWSWRSENEACFAEFELKLHWRIR